MVVVLLLIICDFSSPQVKALLLYMLKCTVDGNKTLKVYPHNIFAFLLYGTTVSSLAVNELFSHQR